MWPWELYKYNFKIFVILILHFSKSNSLYLLLYYLSNMDDIVWFLAIKDEKISLATQSSNFPLLFKNSVQFSLSVVSDSLLPHEPQHARCPCPSTTPRVHPNPCPLSRWCHPIISSSVLPFSSCPQTCPASRSFPMSQLFTSGGQIIGVSASTSILPVNIQDWFPLGWTG